MIRVSVQRDDFDAAFVLRQVSDEAGGVGAVASFIGIVRPESEGERLVSLEVEHYPGMTERELARIAGAAASRWPLSALSIIHRFGVLEAGAQIVLVVAASSHRQAAFDAVQFVMDYLKTQAPFWKREHRSSGSYWVEARVSDTEAAARWDLS